VCGMPKDDAVALVASDYAGRVDAPAAKPAVVAPSRQARHLAA
jgi:hypothetical protein